MKNIFVATDFSPAATDAAIYALEFAHLLDARVHLFFGCGAPVKLTSAYDPVDTAHIIREAKTKLLKYSEQLPNKHEVILELYVSDGHVPDAIVEEARRCKADLIICGMKEKGKSMKRIFGSVVYSLINRTEMPLLVIPEGAEFQKPHHLALAADTDPETSPATLEAMQHISEKFFSKISVINVLNENFEEKDVRRFQPPSNVSELKHLYPRYEFPIGDDVAQTIHQFAKERKFDILAIIPHKRNWMNRLLTQSITRNLVAYSNLPVLVLPQTKSRPEEGRDMERVYGLTSMKRDEYHC